jgi:hypothetical protein
MQHTADLGSSHYWSRSSFIIRLSILVFVLTCAIYIHERPYNSFSDREHYMFKPEQSMVSEGILELNESNWEEHVSFRIQPILLFLYAPSVRCAWSNDFADVFVQLNRQIKNDEFPEIRNITVAKLDGFTNRFLAFELGIRGFPSLMLLEAPMDQERRSIHNSTSDIKTDSTKKSSGIEDDPAISYKSELNNEKQNVVENDNTGEERFDGSFIRKTILEELDGFGGLTLNRINRNEYVEYKGKRELASIMLWLYKHILSHNNAKTRKIHKFEHWQAIVQAKKDSQLASKRFLLVLVYNSLNISKEQINCWNNAKGYIEMAVFDLKDVSLEETKKAFKQYSIDIDTENIPRVFLFALPYNDNEMRLLSELKLQRGMDRLLIQIMKQEIPHWNI